MGRPEIIEKREIVGFENAKPLIDEGWIVLSNHPAGERQIGEMDPPLTYVLGRPVKYDEKGNPVDESPEANTAEET